MTKMKVRFCWLCGNQLCGNHFKLLVVDTHERVFHKTCAKTVEKNFVKREDGYYSMGTIWEFEGER